MTRRGLCALGLALVTTGLVFAASNSDLTQTINAGALSTDIKDETGASVSSPSVAMSAKSFSFDCYAGGTASTGTLGSNTQRLYVINPDGADNGWTLTIAATGGATSTWANGGATRRIDFNDSTGATAGCSDGADADAVGGQLTINAAAGSLTTDCASCTTSNITLGSSAPFVQGSTDSITHYQCRRFL